jgi:hypothetical protein
MKKMFRVIAMTLLLAGLAFGQALNNGQIGSVFNAAAFGSYQGTLQTSVASGAGTAFVDLCLARTSGFGGVTFTPLFVNNKLTVVDANTETVAVTAVNTTPQSAGVNGLPSCSFTATFSNAHGAGARVISGTFGFEEAVNFALSTGGIVTVGPEWGGATANITASSQVGGTGVSVLDQRSGNVQLFGWTGSVYASVFRLAAVTGGSITTNGTAVGAGTCQAQPALTVTGATTGSTVTVSVPTALPATWQTGIFILPVVTANTVTLSLCNGTAGSITPAAQVVNIRVYN